MRLTDEEIVMYAISNGIRSIRDNDLNAYYFLLGTTDEDEHWMRTTMYGTTHESRSPTLGGCLYKDTNGRFSRQTYHQTEIRDGAFTLDSTYQNHRLVQPQFINLVNQAVQLNHHQITHLAQQIRDMFVLDLSYKTEPYIEILPTSWDNAYAFYRSRETFRSDESEKILAFP